MHGAMWLMERKIFHSGQVAVFLAATVGALNTCLLPPEAEPRIEFVLPAEPLLVDIGDVLSPEIVVRANGVPVANARVQLQSSDPQVVAVDSGGALRGIQLGVAAIAVRLLSSAVATSVPDTAFEVRAVYNPAFTIQPSSTAAGPNGASYTITQGGSWAMALRVEAGDDRLSWLGAVSVEADWNFYR